MINYSAFWDQLGTAFSTLDEDAKTLIENIWEMFYSYLDDLNTKTYVQQFNTFLQAAFPFYTQASIMVVTYCNGDPAYKESYDLGTRLITGTIVVPGGVEATHSETFIQPVDKLQKEEEVFTVDKIYLFDGDEFKEFDGSFILWSDSGYAV